MPIYSLDGISPEFDDLASNWIAPDAVLIGRVRLGRNAGIWFGAVIRGDNEPIAIGARHQRPGTYGDAHRSGLSADRRQGLHDRPPRHAAWLHDRRQQPGRHGRDHPQRRPHRRDSLVGAGALVTEGKEFPERSLIVGSPAKAIRTLDDAAFERLKMSAAHYVENARRFRLVLETALPVG